MNIRSIVSEVVAEQLPLVVRAIILEDIGGQSPGTKKRTARPAKDAPSRASKKPDEAVKAGVSVGQRWRGKSYAPNAAGRLIQIAVLTKDGIIPKVIKTVKGKRPTAKKMGYEQLLRSYERV